MTRKSTLIISSIAVVSAAIVGSFLWSKNRQQYDLIPVKVGPIQEAIYGIGTVVSKNKFSFKVALPKTVLELFAAEGERVEKGQPLLRFDDGLLVKSPLQGTVISLPYNRGENVFTERAAVVVEDQINLFLEVALDQQGSMRVKSGQKANVSFETLEGTVFTGQVDLLYHSPNGFIAKVSLEKFPDSVLPGMTADVAIQVAEKSSAVLVPARSLQMGYILLQRAGRRQKLPVTVGVMDKDWVEVTSGNIENGDLILVKKQP